MSELEQLREELQATKDQLEACRIELAGAYALLEVDRADARLGRATRAETRRLLHEMFGRDL